MITILKADLLITPRRFRRPYRSPKSGRVRGNHQCRLLVRRENGTTTSVFTSDRYTFTPKGSWTMYRFVLDGKRVTLTDRFSKEKLPRANVVVGTTWASAVPYKSPT